MRPFQRHYQAHNHPFVKVLLLLFLALPLYAAVAPPVAADSIPKSSAEAIAIVKELAAKDEQQLTYLGVVVAASRIYQLDLNTRKIEDQIQAIADKVKAAVVKSAAAPAKIAAISKVIYMDCGFHSETELDISPLKGDGALDASMLHRVLERKQGICLGLATLYLTVTERAGLSIFPVHAPYHIFCRMEEGGSHFNIECMDNGIVIPDAMIVRNVGATPAALKGDHYFRRLTKKEVLGDQLNNLAYDLGTRKKGPAPLTWPQLVELIDLAVKLEPKAHEILDSSALIHFKSGDPVRALAICDQAIELCREYGAPAEVLPSYIKRRQEYKKAVQRSKMEKVK